jgi:acyl phosphate:glycerol-3-phosphate acyltransferase
VIGGVEVGELRSFSVYLVDVAAVVGAYLVGTFPTAILIGRTTGHDPTREGSGNPGASNVYRTSGRTAGATVLLGDVAKGMIAAGIGWAIDGRLLGFACVVAATLGHSYPVFRRFRGGKGVATAGGGIWVLMPIVAAICIATFFLLVKVLNKASLASLVIAAMVPLGAIALRRPGWEIVFCVAIFGIITVRHTGNIRRLLSGTELPVESRR